MSSSRDVDVLIIGAGPTGLMLANQLARWGIRPLIIDRHSGPAEQTRAVGVQARTLEIYAKMRLADAALALGARASGANLWANGRPTARIPLGDIGQDVSRFPFLLVLGQDDNERIMGDLLRERGVEVEWQTELVGLSERAEVVEARVRRADGVEETILAKWIAGCDGSRSAVRAMNGIGFPGAPYEHVFFVADTEATGAMRGGELNIYLWEGGFHLFFPMRGTDRWRVIGILPKQFACRDDLKFDDLIPSIQRETGASLAFKSCHWFSTYRIQHRAAEHVRKGRCVLLGDAAHIHSPAGAQGMNTGLQDAYNLAWKLALVVQGHAKDALLATYEEERLPVARRLLATTDRAFKLLVSEGMFGRVFRTRILARLAAFAMRFAAVRSLAFSTISQLGVSYRGSSLSREAAPLPETAPQAGDRFPWMHLKFSPVGPAEDIFERLDDLAFNLLLFGQNAPILDPLGRLAALVRPHVVPDDPANRASMKKVAIPEISYFLIRPDGHIGLCGGAIDMKDVTEYAAETLGAP